MREYLIQALDQFRVEVHGQFDQVSYYQPKVCQDAAAEMHRMHEELEALKKGVVVRLDDYKGDPGVGFITQPSWGAVAKLLEAADSYKVSCLTLQPWGPLIRWVPKEGHRE